MREGKLEEELRPASKIDHQRGTQAEAHGGPLTATTVGMDKCQSPQHRIIDLLQHRAESGWRVSSGPSS